MRGSRLVGSNRSNQDASGLGTALKVGCAAERAVVDFLKSEGCEILGVNVRVGHLELDVVARLDDMVLVVEVRTRGRGAWVSAFESIDRKKRARVRTAGERLWDRQLKHDPRLMHLRFDTASVSFAEDGATKIEYVPAAF